MSGELETAGRSAAPAPSASAGFCGWLSIEFQYATTSTALQSNPCRGQASTGKVTAGSREAAERVYQSRQAARAGAGHMSDLEKILLTSVLTIAGGVSVFVIGQLLSKFIIEPVHELRKAIGQVRFNLAFHSPVIHTPIARSEDRSREAREALWNSSCQLIVAVQAIPAYSVIRCLSLGGLPGRKATEDAAVQLRGLSTHVYDIGEKALNDLDRVNARVAKIERLLGLRPLE